ncbi:hypothetical protein DL95DRAFT_386477 [Leptodontidium sp. 2 PMI_412]|nr:hypothetical protein DL95DRAFT_386477 [Leptodontidium sp. 2 PMI_412]
MLFLYLPAWILDFYARTTFVGFSIVCLHGSGFAEMYWSRLKGCPVTSWLIANVRLFNGLKLQVKRLLMSEWK